MTHGVYSCGEGSIPRDLFSYIILYFITLGAIPSIYLRNHGYIYPFPMKIPVNATTMDTQPQ